MNWAAVAKLVARIGFDVGQTIRRFGHADKEHNIMPAVFVPGGPYLPAGTYPIRLFNARLTDAETGGAEFINETEGLIIVAGIDACATKSSPAGPFWVDFTIEGTEFYHDSQSIGEGKGITFSWRGAHLLFPGEALNVSFDGSGDTVDELGFIGWAIITANIPFGP